MMALVAYGTKLHRPRKPLSAQVLIAQQALQGFCVELVMTCEADQLATLEVCTRPSQCYSAPQVLLLVFASYRLYFVDLH